MRPPSQAVLSSATRLLGHHLLHAGRSSHRPTLCSHSVCKCHPEVHPHTSTMGAFQLHGQGRGMSCAHILGPDLEPHRNISKDISRAFLLSHAGQRGRPRPAFAPMLLLPRALTVGTGTGALTVPCGSQMIGTVWLVLEASQRPGVFPVVSPILRT